MFSISGQLRIGAAQGGRRSRGWTALAASILAVLCAMLAVGALL